MSSQVRLRQLRITPADILAPCSLTVLLFAGYIKAAPLLRALPVDLTVVAAAATLVACVGPTFRAGFRLPRGVTYIVGLWLSFSLVVLYIAERTSYSSVKIPHLFTLTLVSAVAPILILTTDLRLRIWYWSLGALSLGVTLMAIASPDQTAADSARLALDGSNTIATARAAGLGLVMLVVVVLAHKPRVLITGPLGLLLLWTLLRAGSRGPVIAVCVAVAVLLAVRVAYGSLRKRRLVWLIVLAGAVLWGAYQLIGNSYALQRALGLVDQRGLATDEYRSLIIGESWQLIQSHPWGIGWGDGYFHFSQGALLASGYTQYSHNLFVEVALEGGWIPGLTLVVFAAASLIRLWKTGANNPMALGIAVFFVVSATVSGDINDNRATFAALALAWVTIRPAEKWSGHRSPVVAVGRRLDAERRRW